MSPFWNQTSPSNLYAASLGVLDCALAEIGKEEAYHPVWPWHRQRRLPIPDFRWKIGMHAMTFLARISPEKKLQLFVCGPGVIQFCGIYGEVQFPPFPTDRLELHSPTRGHVGTVELVPENPA